MFLQLVTAVYLTIKSTDWAEKFDKWFNSKLK